MLITKGKNIINDDGKKQGIWIESDSTLTEQTKLVICQIKYKNGIKDGRFKCFYSNTNQDSSLVKEDIALKGKFKNGKREGKWSFYEKGERIQVRFYENGEELLSKRRYKKLKIINRRMLLQ